MEAFKKTFNLPLSKSKWYFVYCLTIETVVLLSWKTWESTSFFGSKKGELQLH